MIDAALSLVTRLALPLVVLSVLFAAVASAGARQPEWRPVPGSLMTRWAKHVDPAAPLPEYPRPTMVRGTWQNLNGLWNYSIAKAGDPTTDTWNETILVPFPIESALSGVKKTVGPDHVLRYRRTFAVDPTWRTGGQRLLLHFGAVDWKCEVFVNGKQEGTHTGGYDPFSFDITEALNTDGANELIVVVTDPTNTGGQPRGKQWNKPHGIWYTPTTGIWQTVWLEPVPAGHIRSLSIAPDLAAGRVTVTAHCAWRSAGMPPIEVEVLDGEQVVAAGSGLQAAHSVELQIPNPKAWAPGSPFLYGVRVRFTDRGVTDEVRSYFGMRSIAVGTDSQGVNRLMLNGKPVFMFGPLDQGFWPDGIYTAPTDEALRFDIEAAQAMGCNMLRKHVKVEPERFYYWCDRMGIMVWQDMPSPFFEEIKPDGSKGWDEDFPALSDSWKENFEREWKAIIESTRRHPSIVMWVPFNEGWGQNDLDWARSMVIKTKQWDPTRLVNNASGWTDMKVGDTMDIHVYPGPASPPKEDARAAVLGEYGGLGLPLDGHTWVNKDNWGYVSYKTKEALTAAYIDQIGQLPMLIAEGLCAAVYTQTTDVEIECNGWLTYDREVWKIAPEQVRPAMRAAFSSPVRGFRVVLARAGQPGGPGTWSYTTSDPGAGWNDPARPADAAGWKQGPAGFGTKGTPGALIGTDWSTPEIWLRSEFQVPPEPVSNLSLSIHHDEDAEVYFNGVLAASLKGYTTGYRVIPVAEAALREVKPGGKVLVAIHCRQTSGGQYIDCGLVEIVRDPEPSKPGATSSFADGDSPVRPREDIRNYEPRSLAGFTLKIHRDFAASDGPLLDRTLVQLAADLDEIAHFLPPAALEAVRGVTIWVERQGSKAMGRGGRGMCCHWSPAWLSSNGLLTEKAGGVEIINPADFLSWRRDQPYMCFHELAHAYHWRLAKLDPAIEGVFEQARSAGLYEQVARNSLPTGKTERAYAITNSHEYFAELSEAYFALNDFYPYTRRQLQAHDPEGFKLMERVWNLSAAEILANTAPREPTTP